jgi:hypothetical protein
MSISSFAQWLRALKSRDHLKYAPISSSGVLSRRPALESLEDRLAPAAFVVASTSDSGAGSLRQAILSANALGGDNTIVLSGVHGTISLNSPLANLSSNLSIVGPGRNLLTVQRGTASATPSFGIFHVTQGATVSIVGLTIANGSAVDGGGIFNQGTLTLLDDTINGNTAGDIGGGIANGSFFPSSSGTLTVIDSTISNNTNASRGEGAGGIDSEGGSLTVINSTISGNRAILSHSAGGIGVYGGTAAISHSTISANVSSGISGGGIDGSGTTVTLFDTIVAGNSGGNGADIAFSFVSLGHNLIGNITPRSGPPASGFTNGTNGDQVGTSKAIINAKLGPLQNNGGPTSTQALLAGSPAINAGDSAGAPAADQRGFVPRVSGSAIDIGAYESGAAAGSTDTLVVFNYPSTEIAGTPHSFGVAVLKPNGDTDTAYAGTVHFSSTDLQAILPLDYTFTAADLGVHAFSALLGTVGTWSLTATDSSNTSITGSEGPISVLPVPDFGSPITTVFGGNNTSGTTDLAIGDFNGDGHLDVAVVSEFGSGSGINILLGDGKGGFTVKGPTIKVGVNPHSIVAADFNNDHKLDLAVTFGNGEVAILLGDGQGDFTPASGSPIATGHSSAGGIVAADFNNDGNMDLAVGAADNFSNFVTVLLGDGKGGFAPAAGSPFATGTVPLALAAGDLNGDHIPDLAVGNFGDNTVTVLLNDGHGGFSPAPSSPLSFTSSPNGLAIADVNKDGHGDLIVATGNTIQSGQVHVLLGDGAGNFSEDTNSPFAVGASPQDVAVADLNGDGSLDLAVANAHDATYSVLYGDGSGGFTPAPGSPYASAGSPFIVGVADFNGDNKPDLITTGFSGAVAVVPNQVGEEIGSKLVLSDFPTSTISGEAHAITVTSTTLSGQTVTNFTGTVHFSSTDTQAGLPSDYTFLPSDHGTHTFSADLVTAGSESIMVAESSQDSVRGSETSIMVSQGSAYHLVIEPFNGAVTAGQPINGTSGVTVEIEDSSGTLVSNDSSLVTIGVNGPGLFTASSTISEAASGGIATFTNLVLGTEGSYTITASDGTLTGSTSSAFLVSGGSATQLEISTEPPADVTAGTGFGVVVEATDSFGNIDTSFSGSITLQTQSNPGGSTLGGMLMLNAKNGVADFSALTLNIADPGYTLEAMSTGLTAATTDAFTVTAGAASQLVVVSPPPGSVTTRTGIAFTVAAEDAFGNVSPTFNGKMTLSLANNPGGARLSGSLTATAVNGVALFTQPSLNKLGINYTLKVTSGTLQSVTTGNFDVVTSPYSARVVKGSGQSTTVETTFAGTLQLAVTNAQGKPATNVPVTFTIVSNTGAGATQSQLTVNTNAAGLALPALTANTVAGTFTVTVSVGGIVLPAAFTETNKAGLPASITVVSGASQTATVGASFAHAIQVVVKDSFGNVVPNAVVTFTAPTTGATGTFSTFGGANRIQVKTNAAGVATAPAFVAGKLPGSYSVLASVSSSAGTFTTSLGETNVAGPPASITVKTGTGQNAKLGTAYATPLQVAVKGRFGNLLSGVAVTFKLPLTGASGTFAGGNLTQVVVDTDSSGVAAAPRLTANAIAGAFSVSASVMGIKLPVMLKLTNTTS